MSEAEEANEFPEFTNYRQLPKEGDAVFRIGPQLVRFTRREGAWHVTTSVEGYNGRLQDPDGTSLNERGESVPYATYEFTNEGPPRFHTNPVDVNAEEFRAIFFGDHALRATDVTPPPRLSGA